MIRKGSILLLIIASVMLSSCLVPPKEKQMDEDLQKIDVDADLTYDPQLEVTPLEDDTLLGTIESVQDTSTNQDQLVKEKVMANLPIGMEPLPQELDGTAQYFVASKDDLVWGRKKSDERLFQTLGLQSTVYFGFDRADLNEESKNLLSAYAEFLIQSSQTIFVLEGHTDETGTSQYNLALGFRRATSVKHFLVSRGVDGRQIETESFGEERPVFDQHDPKYQRYNRRVELYFR